MAIWRRKRKRKENGWLVEVADYSTRSACRVKVLVMIMCSEASKNCTWIRRLVEGQKGLETKVGLRVDLINSGRSEVQYYSILSIDECKTELIVSTPVDVSKIAEVKHPDYDTYVERGSEQNGRVPFLSGMKARKLLWKGCQGYLAYLLNKPKEEVELEIVPVMKEFIDVFYKELTTLPPDRELEFSIELVSCAKPISRTLYQIAHEELRELKKQLQELLQQGYIHLSTSPWGASDLLVKKKYGTLECV
ncbi:hypothetical protein M9H77_04408 [Catharanthus roseus]|uniref:Uncharacterized protein n=1 Tax=Catharanthus roseus TaxID=4058 RepID=A0ACC0CE23_CATRO|nr:hypothetical protein M9H77_04408 [Catharanthus roseus]